MIEISQYFNIICFLSLNKMLAKTIAIFVSVWILKYKIHCILIENYLDSIGFQPSLLGIFYLIESKNRLA